MNHITFIGLLSPYLAPFRAYEYPAINLDLDLIVFSEHNILWKTGQVDGLVWKGTDWVKKRKPIPKSIYNRYYGPKLKVITRLETVIGKNKVFNHVTHLDKWQVHQILSKSALAPFIPITELYEPQELITFLEKHTRAIIKPRHGRLGVHIYLVEKDKQQYGIYHGTKYPIFTYKTKDDFLKKLDKVVGSDFLIQQYLPLSQVDGRIFDLRFLVQKNGDGLWCISGILSRLALKYGYITNLVQSIIPGETALRKSRTAKPISISALEKISLQAAVALESHFGSLGELSVDIGVDVQGYPWIIEVNGKPMKNMFEALHDPVLLEKVYEMPLAYARFLAQK